MSKKVIAGIVIVILLVAGLIYFFIVRGRTQDAMDASTLSPTPAFEEPTETPEPTISKEDVSIRVLNGSGIAGEAGRVQTMLEDAGFTVDETDNADTFDNTSTDIQAKSSVPSSIVGEIDELLTEEYTTSTSTLDDEEDVDIVIVVGARRNAPTSTPKPTAKPTSASDEDDSETTPTPTRTPTPTP